MSYKIEEIEGICPAYAAKLAAANIKTTDHLLEKCCSPAGRKEVAKVDLRMLVEEAIERGTGEPSTVAPTTATCAAPHWCAMSPVTMPTSSSVGKA